jgi:hypothetical protein
MGIGASPIPSWHSRRAAGRNSSIGLQGYAVHSALGTVQRQGWRQNKRAHPNGGFHGSQTRLVLPPIRLPDPVSDDGIIPRAVVPELDNVIANLE